MKREDAIRTILENVKEKDIVLFSTGWISREAFAIKDRNKNFYMLGSMGLLSSFALGISIAKPEARIIIVEGDGSAWMSLGNWNLIGQLGKNILHIILCNKVYGSTGDQPLPISSGSFLAHAAASFYHPTIFVQDELWLKNIMLMGKATAGLSYRLAVVEIDDLSYDKNLPRIQLKPEEIKKRFREAIK